MCGFCGVFAAMASEAKQLDKGSNSGSRPASAASSQTRSPSFKGKPDYR